MIVGVPGFTLASASASERNDVSPGGAVRLTRSTVAAAGGASAANWPRTSRRPH